MNGAANKEKIVRADAFGIAGENFYALDAQPALLRTPSPARSMLIALREGAAQALARCEHDASPTADLELLVFDAWRPQAVQAYFHDQWLPDELRAAIRALRRRACRAKCETYWAAPSAGDDAPSPHSTGGAVDLTIRWRGGDPLVDGVAVRRRVAARAHGSFRGRRDISADAFSFSDEEARANRRLLYWLMRRGRFCLQSVRMVAFLAIGDQMWAKLRASLQRSMPVRKRPADACRRAAARARFAVIKVQQKLSRRPNSARKGRPSRNATGPLPMKLLSGNSNQPLAQAIAEHLDTPLAQAEFKRFKDNEIFVEIQENVRGEDVFFIQSTSFPANDNLMELLIGIDALRRAIARAASPR